MATSLLVRATVCIGLVASALPGSLLAQNPFPTDALEYHVIPSAPGDQDRPAVAISRSGGYIVWEDNSTYAYRSGRGVRAQALNQNFLPIGSSFRVNSTGGFGQEHERPAGAVFPAGGAVFAWQGGKPNLQHIYARFLSRTNTWVGSDVLVNTATNKSQRDPAMAVLGNGNVVIIWASMNQAGSRSLQDVYATVFSSRGERLTGEFLVNEFTTFNQRTPAVAALASGGFVVAWISEQQSHVGVLTNMPSVDVYARKFSADGIAFGGEFVVNTNYLICNHPAVAGLSDGGFIAAWDQVNFLNRTQSLDIVARSFTGGGAASAVTPVNTFTYGDQYWPVISSAGDDVLVAWTSLGEDGSQSGVFGRYLHGNASVNGPEFRLNTTVLNAQRYPALASDGGRIVATWSSFANRLSDDLMAKVYPSANYVPASPTNFFGAPPRESFGDDVPPSGIVTGKPGREVPGTNSTPSAGAGVFSGLFYDPDGVSPASAGYFSAKLTDRGGYSAKVMIGGKSYSFSGALDGSKSASQSSGKAGSALHLQFGKNGSDLLTGSVAGGSWQSPLVADRLVYSRSGSLAPARGTYTVVFPPDNRYSNSPAGYGVGSVKVDSGGMVQFAGVLADGSKVTQKSAVSKQGLWPFYAPVYGGSGVVVSWLQFTNQAGSDLSGEVIWMRPPGQLRKNMNSYPGGFTNDAFAVGSVYSRPPGGRRVLDLRDAEITFSGGGLSDSWTNNARLELNNKLTSLDGNKLTFSLNPATGLFKGSAGVAGFAKPVAFQGAVLQSTNAGLGFFLNTFQNLSGQVYLGPPSNVSTNANP